MSSIRTAIGNALIWLGRRISPPPPKFVVHFDGVNNWTSGTIRTSANSMRPGTSSLGFHGYSA